MAQRSVSAFKATKNSRYTANTSGDISSTDGSDMFEDTADSFLNITDHFIDEDSFASDSASKVPSQQSVKAYVAAQVSAGAVNDTDIKYFEQGDWVSNSSNGTDDIIERGWANFYSGAGAGRSYGSFGVNATENVLGEIELTTGTATSGYSVLAKSGAGIGFDNGFTMKLRYRAALEVLSDGTNTYTVYMGFGDSNTGIESTDGAYFRYTHSVNSGKWEAVTSAGGVRGATDTGVTADVTTYHIFEIRTDPSGTSVTFYIDGALVATRTTNLPVSGGGNYTGLRFLIAKSAGTTARELHMDWFDFLATRTTAR